MRETAVKMPGHEKPLSFRMLVRQTTAELSHVSQWVWVGKFSLFRRSAETSLGAAGMSACATSGTFLPTLQQTFEGPRGEPALPGFGKAHPIMGRPPDATPHLLQ